MTMVAGVLPVDVSPLSLLSQEMEELNWTHEIKENCLYTGATGKDYYPATLTWEEQFSVVHLVCVLELDTRAMQESEMDLLLREINQKLYVGHLEFRSEHSAVVFRHGTLLPENEDYTAGVLGTFDIAIEVLDIYGDACKSVATGGTAEAALNALAAAYPSPDEEPEWAKNITTPMS